MVSSSKRFVNDTFSEIHEIVGKLAACLMRTPRLLVSNYIASTQSLLVEALESRKLVKSAIEQLLVSFTWENVSTLGLLHAVS